MPTIGTEVLTYADWAKRLDPDGRIDKIVELLYQWNMILEDMLVMQANDGTTHKTTVRTGIPEATWRLLNYGVPRVKSRTAQVRDSTGMLEAYSEVDKALAELSGSPASFRLSEATAVLQGMNNQMATETFYGNTSITPERFMGLTPRYSTGDPAVAESAANVVDGGGDDALGQTSIWLVTWGENTTHGLFPKGSMAGFQHKDLGEQTLLDDQGGMYQGLRDHFKWDLGLTVRDWRFNVRIANVEVSLLTDPTYILTLIGLMIQASELIPTLGVGRSVWYMSRRVRTALRLAILAKTANNLTWETVAGKRVMMFDDIPVKRVDALLHTEAVVTFA